MVKWACTIDRKPKALLQFLPISRPGEKTLHYNNKEKATIFVEQFFPLLVETDFSNIPGFIYLEPQNAKKEVEEKDIIMALKGLAPDKAPGPKKIINQFFKTCGEQLAPILAKLFGNCIATKYHSGPFKDSITVVL